MKYVKLFLFLSTFLLSMQLLADNKYAVSEIPSQLLENAHAVVRYDYLKFETKGDHKGTKTFKYAITILNENGLYYTHVTVPYDKDHKLVSFVGKIYDANGTLIKVLDAAEDIIDMSNIPFGTLFTDSRVKIADMLVAKFPFTIEVEYIQKVKDLLFFPTFLFQPNNETSVEQSIFEIVIPEGSSFRFKEFNFEGKLDSIKEGKVLRYIWTETNLNAFEDEVYSFPFDKSLSRIITTANTVNFYNYIGKISTWEEFGKWVSRINDVDRELPLELKTEINELVKNASTELEKIQLIYKYVQSNTRYVNISYNIGGLRPQPPSTVYHLGYGDCKALTMYTMELLKITGIKSHYTLVKSGNSNTDIHISLPSFQFNHAILCVPQAEDTIWLECTSQTLPFGFLGSFTDDRHVLLITEKGGKIAKTSSYGVNDNKRFMTAEIDLQKSGDADAKLSFHYKGLEYDKVDFDQLIEAGNSYQKDWLYESLELSSFTITELEFKEDRKTVPEANITMNLDIKSFLSSGSHTMYFRPNMSLKWLNIPAIDSNRKTNLYFEDDYQDSISIVYTVPYGAEIDYLPSDKNETSDFGEYHCYFERLEKKVFRYTRSLKIHKGNYPPEKFNEYVAFVRKVVKADKELVILKKT